MGTSETVTAGEPTGFLLDEVDRLLAKAEKEIRQVTGVEAYVALYDLHTAIRLLSVVVNREVAPNG